jgi:hypothetical protein
MAVAALAGYKSGETSQVNVLNWKNVQEIAELRASGVIL